jgi:hypothetical protein
MATGVGGGRGARSVGRFAAEGRGTLAPWDPPRELVITWCSSGRQWCSAPVRISCGPCVFLAVNALYIPLVEEPGLARRFGDGYREYCRHVPRLIPRLKPWTDGATRP